MRSNKGLGRKAARAKRLAQESVKEQSVFHIRLAHKFARDPDFRKSEPVTVVTQASANEKKRVLRAEKDLKAGRGGQKESRISVRAAHRRKVKAEKRTCKCPACHKGEV